MVLRGPQTAASFRRATVREAAKGSYTALLVLERVAAARLIHPTGVPDVSGCP